MSADKIQFMLPWEAALQKALENHPELAVFNDIHAVKKAFQFGFMYGEFHQQEVTTERFARFVRGDRLDR